MSEMDSSQYTWAGRFSEPMSELVKRYTASVILTGACGGTTSGRRWRTPPMLARQGIISATTSPTSSAAWRR
jgi:argininosuccinate lyase